VRLERLVARGFRNLRDVELEPPPEGVALLGRNGQGKTNLLEAIHYQVLFRSLRGAADAEVVRFGAPGFRVESAFETGGSHRTVATTYLVAGRRKRIAVDGEELGRLVDAAGAWIAVAFLPSDVALAGGSASGRRQYLDQLLSLADRRYLVWLSRYRAALAQRNSALRQGRPELAWPFDAPLAAAGAELVAARLRWLETAAPQFAAEFAGLGEAAPADLAYTGRPELAEREAWREVLEQARARDRARGMTTIGPHRDDLSLSVGERPLREFGSTGQQRSGAIALKLIELVTLREARGLEPALLLDDVFAELDRDRQRRLAERLLAGDGGAARQVFLTAPRRDELPENLALPIWEVEAGEVRPHAARRDG
jgi:DNA replication and repair protein RecF